MFFCYDAFGNKENFIFKEIELRNFSFSFYIINGLNNLVGKVNNFPTTSSDEFAFLNTIGRGYSNLYQLALTRNPPQFFISALFSFFIFAENGSAKRDYLNYNSGNYNTVLTNTLFDDTETTFSQAINRGALNRSIFLRDGRYDTPQGGRDIQPDEYYNLIGTEVFDYDSAGLSLVQVPLNFTRPYGKLNFLSYNRGDDTVHMIISDKENLNETRDGYLFSRRSVDFPRFYSNADVTPYLMNSNFLGMGNADNDVSLIGITLEGIEYYFYTDGQGGVRSGSILNFINNGMVKEDYKKTWWLGPTASNTFTDETDSDFSLTDALSYSVDSLNLRDQDNHRFFRNTRRVTRTVIQEFWGNNDFPRTGAISSGKLILGGTRSFPARIWGSYIEGQQDNPNFRISPFLIYMDRIPDYFARGDNVSLDRALTSAQLQSQVGPGRAREHTDVIEVGAPVTYVRVNILRINTSSAETRSYFHFSPQLNFSILEIDPFNFQLSQSENNSIQWLQNSFFSLHLGTESGEYLVQNLNPTGVTIVPQSFYGSARVTPVNLDNTFIFVGQNGKRLYYYSYNDQSSQLSFQAEDLDLLNKIIHGHAGDESSVIKKLVVDYSNKIVLILNSFGGLYGLRISGSNQNLDYGFFRLSFNGARVDDIVSIRSEGRDTQFFLSIRRGLNVSLESLTFPFYTQETETTFDAGQYTWDGTVITNPIITPPTILGSTDDFKKTVKDLTIIGKHLGESRIAMDGLDRNPEYTSFQGSKEVSTDHFTHYIKARIPSISTRDLKIKILTHNQSGVTINKIIALVDINEGV